MIRPRKRLWYRKKLELPDVDGGVAVEEDYDGSVKLYIYVVSCVEGDKYGIYDIMKGRTSKRIVC
jgi:hypothetical protein